MTFCKGMVMGVADIVPGISGSTIALLLGIYERLIRSIKELNVLWIWHYLRFFFTARTSALHNARREFKRIDWEFFIPLGLGIAIVLFIGAHLFSYLFNTYLSQTLLFFIGIILASTILLFKRIEKPYSGVTLISGVLIGLAVGLFVPTTTSDSFTMWVLSGFIAMSVMLLPGVSGSYVLYILGKYEQTLQVIRSPFDHFLTLVFFGIGALLALYTMSRVVSWLLTHFHTITLQFLVGLIIGSLAAPIRQIAFVSWTGAVLFLVGLCIPFLLHMVLTSTRVSD